MEEELSANAQKITAEMQYEIRKTIVRMLKKGMKGNEIAKILDVSKGHVSNVKKAYAENGIKGIKPKHQGRCVGEKRILSADQEKEIQKIIIDKNPDQLRLKGCMWTRNNIRDLIKEKYGIVIKVSTLGYYLQRWGFSVQRPIKRAYKQDQEKVNKWLNEEFPGITSQSRILCKRKIVQ